MPWAEHWSSLRDRLTADARFRRWIAANPLTRQIARRRARALFDLCAGFVYSQILQACVRLRLFEILHEGPRTVPELATRLALSTEATERLLRATGSLNLSEERSGGRHGLGSLGAAMIGNPGLAALIEHHAIFYADLRDPVALLRGKAVETALARYWAYAGAADPQTLQPEQTRAYTALMSASQNMVATEILSAYRFDRHHCLLDVGGGDGAFIAAAAAHAPNLQFVLFDLPAVADAAGMRFAREGLAGRATAVGGDFFVEPLPRGADVLSLVRVLHDHDDSAALQILRAARRALAPGGTLLIAEPMSQTPGAGPVGDAYFGFYFMAIGRGRTRTRHEIAHMLMAAGFERVRFVPTNTPLVASLIVASC